VKLYFVRHGSAASKTTWKTDDGLRPLTPSGRQRFSAAAEALADAGVLDPALIVTSPLVRAEQTAKLLRKVLGGSTPIVFDARLGHEFDVAALAQILAEHNTEQSLAIIGHNPSFAAVLSAVVGGADIDVRKGAIALVEIDDVATPSGRLIWLAPPTLFASGS
jgi:phosphohistidine phosphatase SixA